MPLKIMLYVSLLLPANILLVKRISNIPMTIFSLFVFFSFLWWRSGNKKERHVYLHQAATGMLSCAGTDCLGLKRATLYHEDGPLTEPPAALDL